MVSSLPRQMDPSAQLSGVGSLMFHTGQSRTESSSLQRPAKQSVPSGQVHASNGWQTGTQVWMSVKQAKPNSHSSLLLQYVSLQTPGPPEELQPNPAGQSNIDMHCAGARAGSTPG